MSKRVFSPAKDAILRFIHPLIFKFLPLFRKYSLEIEGKIPEQQCLFIANHFCVHDIPFATEVIGKHTYVLVSDEDKNTLNGLALSMNGIIWIHRTDKQDRIRARNDVIEYLNSGCNILMYPESTWNLTASLPMLPMNWGVIGISKETKVPICPMYLLFDEKKCFVKIGEPFLPVLDDAKEIERLRDKMATMCFDLMEKIPIALRCDVPDNYEQASVDNRYNEYTRAKKDPQGVRKYESQFIFQSKSVISPEDVFAPIANIREENITAGNIDIILAARRLVQERQNSGFQRLL